MLDYIELVRVFPLILSRFVAAQRVSYDQLSLLSTYERVGPIRFRENNHTTGSGFTSSESIAVDVTRSSCICVCTRPRININRNYVRSRFVSARTY